MAESPESGQQLSREDVGFILESLRFTKLRFQDYQHYPSYEFRRSRIEECERVMEKVRTIRDKAPNS